MEQKTRGGRGFWYIWGSVLIKLGIAYLVYMAAVSLLAGVHLMQMTGGDADAMMQIAQSTAQSGKLYDQITNELMNWAVYIEGVAALITIPVMLFLFPRRYPWSLFAASQRQQKRKRAWDCNGKSVNLEIYCNYSDVCSYGTWA